MITRRRGGDTAWFAMYLSRTDAITALLATGVSSIWTTTVPGSTTALGFGTENSFYSCLFTGTSWCIWRLGPFFGTFITFLRGMIRRLRVRISRNWISIIIRRCVCWSVSPSTSSSLCFWRVFSSSISDSRFRIRPQLKIWKRMASLSKVSGILVAVVIWSRYSDQISGCTRFRLSGPQGDQLAMGFTGRQFRTRTYGSIMWTPWTPPSRPLWTASKKYNYRCMK